LFLFSLRQPELLLPLKLLLSLLPSPLELKLVLVLWC
jgi:hypothetical protein